MAIAVSFERGIVETALPGRVNSETSYLGGVFLAEEISEERAKIRNSMRQHLPGTIERLWLDLEYEQLTFEFAALCKANAAKSKDKLAHPVLI